MSVDGWSEEGTDRFRCLVPPGGDGNFVPNTFCGLPWPQAAPFGPTVTPGTGDFAIELWARRKYQGTPAGTDNFFNSGILENASGGLGRTPIRVACIAWSTSDNSTSAIFDALGAGAPSPVSVPGTPTRVGGWNHYVMNCDRDANMEYFIDAESKGTTVISAQTDSVTGEFHPLTSDRAGDHHRTTFTTWTFNIFPVIIGPMAIHGRLLTDAEIHSSYLNRKVQNISGSSILVWDWTKVEGYTGWDTDWSHMMLGHKIGMSSPAGAPQGAAGTITVPDQSGNGNTWTLPTVEDYTLYDSAAAVEDGLWPFCMASDPFFR